MAKGHSPDGHPMCAWHICPPGQEGGTFPNHSTSSVCDTLFPLGAGVIPFSLQRRSTLLEEASGGDLHSLCDCLIPRTLSTAGPPLAPTPSTFTCPACPALGWDHLQCSRVPRSVPCLVTDPCSSCLCRFLQVRLAPA